MRQVRRFLRRFGRRKLNRSMNLAIVRVLYRLAELEPALVGMGSRHSVGGLLAVCRSRR